METTYWLRLRLRDQWARWKAGLPRARGIASWPARALLSGAGTGAGHGFILSVILVGCAVAAPRARLPPPPAALPPGVSAVSVAGSGIAVCGVDRCPPSLSIFPARGRPPTEGCGGATWHRGARGDADAYPGDTVLPPQGRVRRGPPFSDPSGSRGCCSLMKSASRLAPGVPTSLLPSGCGSQDAPARQWSPQTTPKPDLRGYLSQKLLGAAGSGGALF